MFSTKKNGCFITAIRLYKYIVNIKNKQNNLCHLYIEKHKKKKIRTSQLSIYCEHLTKNNNKGKLLNFIKMLKSGFVNE